MASPTTRLRPERKSSSVRRHAGSVAFAALLALPVAATALAKPGDTFNISLDNGAELQFTGDIQYDWARFDHDRLVGGGELFTDANTWRRQQFDLRLVQKGRYTVRVGYDFHADAWTDNDVSFSTAGGQWKLGEFRTPVGWEKGTESGAQTMFMESALPVEMIFEGRRAGVGWTWNKTPHWTVQALWFAAHDLNHDGDGTTTAGRVVYAPMSAPGQVLHLGLALSREQRDSHTARFRARPETHLTPVRLVDTGKLSGIDHIDRGGFEAGWLQGPLLIQGEYLAAHAARRAGPTFDGSGYYLQGGWMLTGQSHSYAHTGFGDPDLDGGGALELALRYSTIDLDDGVVRGGSAHDWTLGLNWYVSQLFKLQANYVRTSRDSGKLPVDPRIVEVRAQFAF
ncbi:MAG TPA: porin [Rhodanobacteraceae bacterium]|nr:porin [Rhodanobacteraceae bacterium]